MTMQRTIWSAVLGSALLAGGCGAAFAAPSNSEGSRATRALNMLVDQGDTPFTHFRPVGRNFVADVKKSGKIIPMLVDPDTGQISRAGAGDVSTAL